MTNIRAAAAPFTPKANAGQVAFIDTGVLGWETLRDALPLGIEAVLVAPEADGVAVLESALAGRRGVDAIHVLSHGFPGGFTLGATRVDRAALAAREAAWRAIGASLAMDADILIYSCSVAAGEGDAFLDDLAEITGANLAASRTLTGAAELGGDWDLGWVRGAVTTPSLDVAGFAGVLAAPVATGATASAGSNQIYVTFDQQLDELNPPPLAAIRAGGTGAAILVNGSGGAISNVEVSGDTLVITYSTNFANGDTIAFVYIDPTSGNDTAAIQNGVGDDVETFPVSFTVGSVATAPIYGGAESYIGEDFITLIFDQQLDPVNLPSVTDFIITINSTPTSVTAVEVDASGTGLKVTLPTTLLAGDTVHIEYYDPTGGDDANAIQSVSGLDAPALGDNLTVTQTRPVEFESAEVNGQFLTLTYSGALASLPTADVGSFQVLVDSGIVAVNSLLVDGPAGTVTLVLSEAVTPGAVVQFQYADPTPGDDTYAIQAPDGEDTASIGITAVSNVTVAPVAQLPPVVTGGAIRANGHDDQAFSVTVFENVTVDVIDALQNVTGMVFTVHNVAVSGEYLRIGGFDIDLLDGANGSSGVGYNYEVSVDGGVATVTLEGMLLSPGDAADLLMEVAFGTMGNDAAAAGSAAVRPVVLRSITDSGADGANTTEVNLVGTVTITDPGGSSMTHPLTSAPYDPAITFSAGTSTQVAFLVTVDFTIDITGSEVTFLPELPPGWSTGNVTIASVDRETLTETPITSLTGTIAQGSLYKVTFDVMASGTDTSGVFPISLSAVSTGLNLGTGMQASTVMMTVEPPDTAPTLTATGETPEFEGGSVSAVSLFTSAVADAEDAGQSFTSLSLSVTGVVDGEEVLVIGGFGVGLIDGNTVAIPGLGAGGGNATAQVTMIATTAFVTVIGLDRDNAQMGTLVESIGYRNDDRNATIGDRVITVTQVTDEGIVNTGTITGVSATVTVTDVTDPDAPVVTSAALTNDTTPVITGTAEEGATITLTIAGATYTTVATGGTWSVDLGAATPVSGTLNPDVNGDNDYTVTATDASSNISETTNGTLTIDTTAPAVPAITSAALTNDATPVITGTAEEGATVTVTVAATIYTTVATGGVWSIDLATDVPTGGSSLALDPNGENSVYVQATDAAGNVSSSYATQQLIIDTTPPTEPAITSLALTNDTTPVITGTAEAGATVTVTVGGATYSTVATAGLWSIDLGTAVPDDGTLESSMRMATIWCRPSPPMRRAISPSWSAPRRWSSTPRGRPRRPSPPRR
jgi:uncharacterized repeat protein (TIGR02059 family)